MNSIIYDKKKKMMPMMIMVNMEDESEKKMKTVNILQKSHLHGLP